MLGSKIYQLNVDTTTYYYYYYYSMSCQMSVRADPFYYTSGFANNLISDNVITIHVSVIDSY
jgi:hypothetical protein